MKLKGPLLLAVSIGLSATAAAQSPIVGISRFNLDRLFTTTVSDFVADYMEVNPMNPQSLLHAIDFDPAATTLWGIEAYTRRFGIIDVATGNFGVQGVASLGLDKVTGLTCSPNGTWYAVGLVPGGSEIWMGDVTTGTFQRLGLINGESVIDVACNSQGDLYCTTISDDALYSIDPSTGAGTLVGYHGVDTFYAQGIDFDWSTDTLYAALFVNRNANWFCSLSLTSGAILTSQVTSSLQCEAEFAIQVPAVGGVGSNYCSANANSIGLAGVMHAAGSDEVLANNLTVTASRLPMNQFGFFLTSTAPGFVPNTNFTSNGNLCLGGAIGRYVGAGQVLSTGATGSFSLAIDLAAMPQGLGTVPVLAGETWYFQAWHRDSVGLGSNFTDGLQIDFQ